MKHILYTRKADTHEGEQSHKSVGRQLLELPDGDYIISIKKKKNIRSLSANRYYHMVWHIYATHTGHYIDEIKREFYDKIMFYELHTDKRGKTTKRFKSSADCDTAEMASLINQQAQWGRDEFPEVIIPRKEDATYMQWLQVESEYTKSFSGF